MASDVSLSDCEMDSWEDNEDWTSTEWADPNNDKKNVTPLLHPGSHQNSSAESQNLKLKALQSASNLASAPDGSTLVKRMLLNDNKAGMEGLDKERINQIIHEASK
ncbi:uncharacterized protein LOC132756446, partial [Ruditapes philippinarum]|uniref:uncharacterized protein LOC132756446 n=1 Tax=Ruditapes philippinarum TaxID=129788 RepID=UPI00295B6653